EGADRLFGIRLRHPAAHGTAAQPFVLEKTKTIQIVVRLYLPARIEIERLGALQPERSAALGIEMPRDHFARPGVKRGARGFGVERLCLYSRSHVFMRNSVQGLVLALAICVTPGTASDWTRFRGPNGSGINETSGLPTEFGPGKNQVWKTPLPPG